MTTRELKDATSLATTSAYGVAKLATNNGTAAGTVVQATDDRLAAGADLAAHIADTSAAHAASAIAVTPTGGIASTTAQAALAELDSEKQPVDSDLTAIAALTPSNDDVLQRKAGAWANRTIAQLKTDLALNPMTTQDDLIVGGSSGAPARLAKGTDGQVLTVDPATHHLVWATPSGGGSSLVVEEVDGTPSGTPSTLQLPNGTLTDEGGGVYRYTPSGGGSADHAYWKRRAALLNPLNYSHYLIDAFNHTIATNGKYYMSGWANKIGNVATTRFESRDIRNPPLFLPVGTNLRGIGSGSNALLLDPYREIGSISNGYDLYHDRIVALEDMALRQLNLDYSNLLRPFLPGPYGTIIRHSMVFDFGWVSIRQAGTGWNLHWELADDAAYTVRVGDPLFFPVLAPNTAEYIAAYGYGSNNRPFDAATLLFSHLPSNWDQVGDATSYVLREDLMGATLDASTIWHRTTDQSGFWEIDTVLPWLRCKANGSSWGQNGIYSHANAARTGKVFECDVYPGYTGQSDSAFPNLMVGFSDGGGYADTNMAHAIDFTTGGGGSHDLYVFENGNSRGAVGSHFSWGSIYRVRITLGASSATYEIQGLPEYPAIGSGSWTDITPGTTSGTTTPVYAGAVQAGSVLAWVGNIKFY